MVVLVAYATDHGSTRGVADRITDRLQQRGVDAEARAVAFAGAVARSHWPATGRAFFRATGGRYGDHRNWPAIDAWADRIAAQLHAKSSV